MYKTIQYILIFVILVVPTSAAIADAFDQTVNQLKTLKDELEQSQTNMEAIQTSIEDQLKTEFANHALKAPQNEFETDADYTARRGQLEGIIAQRRAELQKERLSSIHGRRLEIQTEIGHLHRRLFSTNDVTATLGRYNANDEYFPITFAANNETVEVKLNITKNNDAPNLKKNWDKVVKTAYISIDPGYRRALTAVQLEYPPLWNHKPTWIFYVLYELGNYNSIAFSPDEKYFITGGEFAWIPTGFNFYRSSVGNIATIWKMEDGVEFRNIDHGDNVYDVAFSPNGNHFVTAGDHHYEESSYTDGKIIRWNMRDGTKHSTTTFRRNSVRKIAFSHDSKYLANVTHSVSGGGVYLWREGSGRSPYWKITIRNWDHVFKVGPTFSHNGRYLAIGPEKQYSPEILTLLNVSTGKRVRHLAHKSSVYSASFSPGGQYLATGTQEAVTLWDIHGRLIRKIDTPNVSINTVSFSPNGEFLALGRSDNYISILRIGTKKIIFETEIPTVRWIQTDRAVNYLVWHPSGNFISDAKKVYRTLLQPEIVSLTPSTLLSSSPIEPVNANETFTIDFTVKGVTDLAGWKLEVSFNPKVLSALEVIEGSFLKTGGGNTFFQDGNINNTTGRIRGVSTAILGGGVSGTGTLFSINFEAKAAGEGKLQLLNAQLSTSSGKTIPHEVLIHPVVVEEGSPSADVNQDSVVNIQDLVLVVSSFGKTGPNAADVNTDGIVDVVDLVLVAGAIGDGAGAPSVWGHDLEIAPTREQVQQWLRQARQMNLTDPTFQRGITMLEQLLAALTPKETSLLPNYPNPFNPETWIPYQLAEPADVTLTIYASDGTVVRTLMLGHQPVGIYQDKSRAAYWDGKNEVGEQIASGIYFYTLTAGDFTATRKMLIRK